MKDGIARQAELAQDFSDCAHNFGQAFGADDNQRNRENESYFKKVQTLMIVPRKCRCNSRTLRRAEKFRATFPTPCQLIIIPDWGVNDA